MYTVYDVVYFYDVTVTKPIDIFLSLTKSGRIGTTVSGFESDKPATNNVSTSTPKWSLTEGLHDGPPNSQRLSHAQLFCPLFISFCAVVFATGFSATGLTEVVWE